MTKQKLISSEEVLKDIREYCICIMKNYDDDLEYYLAENIIKIIDSNVP